MEVHCYTFVCIWKFFTIKLGERKKQHLWWNQNTYLAYSFSFHPVHFHSHDKPFMPRCLPVKIAIIILCYVAFLSKITTLLFCFIITSLDFTVLYPEKLQFFMMYTMISFYDFFILGLFFLNLDLSLQLEYFL